MKKPVDSTFVELMNAHQGIIHRISRIYFDNYEDRQDVAQEMMYQLWISYESFDSRSKFSTWMYKVCLNTALTYQRKQKKTKTESLSPIYQGVEEGHTQNQDAEIEHLYQAISTLSPLNKSIILLYLDSLSYDEIAALTGLTKTNVSVRLVRIKKELENILKSKNTDENT